jgi:hypothetical protein
MYTDNIVKISIGLLKLALHGPNHGPEIKVLHNMIIRLINSLFQMSQTGLIIPHNIQNQSPNIKVIIILLFFDRLLNVTKRRLKEGTMFQTKFRGAVVFVQEC